MGRRKMGEGGLLRVLFGADPVGSPAGGGCGGTAVLVAVAGLAGLTAGLTVASHAAMGLL